MLKRDAGKFGPGRDKRTVSIGSVPRETRAEILANSRTSKFVK